MIDLTDSQQAAIKETVKKAIYTTWNDEIYEKILTKEQQKDRAVLNSAAHEIVETLETLSSEFWLAVYHNPSKEKE